jgi:hypothetical protein
VRQDRLLKAIIGAVYTVATTVPALRPEWAEMNRPADSDGGR